MPNHDDEDFEGTVDALRALIGGSPVARAIVKKPLQPNLKAGSYNTSEEPVLLSANDIPKALKTFKVGDFMRLKKHKNDSAQLLVKKFVEKHGKVKPGSKELQVLVKAISRLQNK